MPSPTDVQESRGARTAPPAPAPHLFDGDLRLMPGVEVPVRSVYLASSRMLISPIGTDAERVVHPSLRVIVAPSLLHHLHVADARRTAPNAQLWGPPGYADKLPDLGEVRVFGRDRWPYDDDIAFELVDGAPRRNEVAFLHRATATLYTADLVFNIGRPAGWLSPLTFRAMGIYQRFAMARPWKHWVKDRAAFSRSIERILDWPFDRIVMAHGEVIETGGKALLSRALEERGLLPR